MDIKHLKRDDAVVLRRVGPDGRYEFHEAKIYKTSGVVARIDGPHGTTVRRTDGREHVGGDGVTTGWEAFPAGHPDVADRTPTQVVPEARVRFVRALARLAAADPAAVAETDVGRQIVAAFGKADEDFKAADVPPQHP